MDQQKESLRMREIVKARDNIVFDHKEAFFSKTSANETLSLKYAESNSNKNRPPLPIVDSIWKKKTKQKLN